MSSVDNGGQTPIYLSRNFGLLIGLVAVLGLGAGIGALNVANQNVPDNQLAADFYNFRNDVVEELKALDKQDEVMAGLAFQIRDNLRNDTAKDISDVEKRMQALLVNEIGKLRMEMILNAPKQTPKQPDPVVVSGELTAKIINSGTVSLGESITISGTGKPDNPVFVVVVTPNRSIQGAAIADETGKWIIDIPTEFEDEAGTWSFRASQGSDRTDSKTFSVK